MSARANTPHQQGVDAPGEAVPLARRAGDRGASAVEYALLIGLIALVIFGALALLGTDVREMFSSIATGY